MPSFSFTHTFTPAQQKTPAVTYSSSPRRGSAAVAVPAGLHNARVPQIHLSYHVWAVTLCLHAQWIL